MRITDSQRFATALQQVTAGTAAVSRAAERLSSGRRFARLSEDPTGGAKVMTLDSDLRALTQYRRAISAGQARLQATESALGQVTDILARARELATAQSNGTANDASRAATAAEVRALREQVRALGNMQVDGEFVFGGRATGVAPFLADDTYIGTPDARVTTIAPGQTLATAPSGQELLVDSTVLTALADLELALTANDVDAVRSANGTVAGAFDRIQTLLAEVGARDRTFQLATEQNLARTDALTAERADLAEIPLAEASLTLAQSQTSLEATFLAISRVQSLNLVDFLR